MDAGLEYCSCVTGERAKGAKGEERRLRSTCGIEEVNRMLMYSEREKPRWKWRKM